MKVNPLPVKYIAKQYANQMTREVTPIFIGNKMLRSHPDFPRKLEKHDIFLKKSVLSQVRTNNWKEFTG